MQELRKHRRRCRQQRSNPRSCNQTTRHHPRVLPLQIAFAEMAQSVNNQTLYMHHTLTIYYSFELGRNRSSRRCRSWVRGWRDTMKVNRTATMKIRSTHVCTTSAWYTQLLMSLIAFTLSSSIHTIHRPVARIRKREQSLAAQGKPEPFIPEEADSDEAESYDEEEEDFDRSAPLPGSRPGPSDSKQPLHHSITFSEGSIPTPKGTLSRTPSLSTVRIQRRTRLAEKLKEVFEVPDIQEVVNGPYFVLKYSYHD